jgi:hypothetical protein
LPVETGSLKDKQPMNLNKKWEQMRDLAQLDLEKLVKAEKSYGDSWRRRGGTGAFMMLARKFDRIEQQSKTVNWDVFEASKKYKGEEGLLDDIGDLRRYLLLVEHFVRYGDSEIEALEWKKDD